MNAFEVGDTVYFPAREFPNDHYANYADYFWFGRVISSSRGGMHTVRTNNCATEYLYDDGALLDWEREYNEARADAGCPKRPAPSRAAASLAPPALPQSSGLGRATLLTWCDIMGGVPFSGRDAISSVSVRSLASKTTVLDEPMPMGDEPAVDQDLAAQVAQLRAAVGHLEAQKVADDARYSAEISELRGKVTVQERIRLADAARYRQDLEALDAERVRQDLQARAAASVHMHVDDATAAASSALRHAHGHCTACHAISLGVWLFDKAIPASHCVV